MIVRTYGRRSREISRTNSDASNPDDAVLDDSYKDSYSLSQDTTQDLYNLQFLSSQDCSSFWSSQEDNHYDSTLQDLSPTRTQFDASENGAGRRSKKQKKGFSELVVPPTSTLMEAQEFGEMMEHVDEVNFAIDGLRKGSQLRIRRASLLSLLSICGTVQQRRLLRSHGMAKTIIDAILSLSLDDSPSNVAVAALLFVLTGDGQDYHLLESQSCICFLIRLLKPVTSATPENKARNIGSKLLAVRKENDILRDSNKALDSSATAILSKVQEILVSCKEMKSSHGDVSGMSRPELNPKWIALLTMEKACLSKISLEDATGSVRKLGGNFKEKLRELGGLDAVVEVAMDCYSVLKGSTEHISPFSSDGKHCQDHQSLVLLLKCLKIMENATFLSDNNQSHLLGMKANLHARGSRLSFTKLMINVIKILSDLSLSTSSATSADQKLLVGNSKDKNKEVIVISSSENSCDLSQNNSFMSTNNLGFSEPNGESTTTSTDGSCFMKMRSRSSLSSSCSGLLRSSNGGNVGSNGSRSRFGHLERLNNNRKQEKCVVLKDSEDPFAFDEDAYEPSKWDLLFGKGKKSRTKKSERMIIDLEEDDCRLPTHTNPQESYSEKHCQELSINGVDRHCSQESACSRDNDKERNSLLADCLLTSIKVLMNLTNENPIGCKEIAACGGLDTMSLLIASHFPMFGSPLPLVSDGFKLDHHDDELLSDEELDFLVAILGLLVNLVEKDNHNRSRLAAARVSLPNSEGSEDENQRDLIPLLCSIFLANGGTGDAAGEGNVEQVDDETAMLQGEKEAEKMIVEAYAALLLAFLSTESTTVRAAIAECLPNKNLATLVPVLERFVAFHLQLNMISSETHKAVSEVIESCRVP